MAIVPKTVEEILDDITDSLAEQAAGSIDAGSGTVLGALVRSFAAPLATLWQDLQVVERDSNIATAEGDSLDLLVNTFGMSRNTGSYASGNLIATPKALSNVANVQAGEFFLFGSLVLTVTATTSLQAPYSVIPVQVGTLGSDFNLPANVEVLSATADLNSKFKFAVGSSLDSRGLPNGGLSGGVDPELDSELRSRFANFLQSLTRATYQAVLQALQAIPELRSVALVDAAPMPGFISVYVDDGSTDTQVSATTRALVESALFEWKAAGVGVRIYVLDKVVQPVVVNIRVSSDSVPSSVEQAVRQALTTLLSGYAQGQSLYVSKLVDVAFNTPGVLDAKIVAPTADVLVQDYQAFRASSVTVNVSI